MASLWAHVVIKVWFIFSANALKVGALVPVRVSPRISKAPFALPSDCKLILQPFHEEGYLDYAALPSATTTR